MLAVKSMDIRDNWKEWCNKIIGGEIIIVSRPKNENVVMLSEVEYNNIMREKHNAEYLAKLERSYEQFENGETVTMSMEQLEKYENQ